MASDIVIRDGEAWWARVSLDAASIATNSPVTYRMMKVLQWERRTDKDGQPELVAWLDADGTPVPSDLLEHHHQTEGLRVRGYDRRTPGDIQALADEDRCRPPRL
ncbi:hypothetical protein FOS14_19695 [Skermania sp. ID1734]|uniref:hypothetical protein n=1 Tax=Skermania sp. ID1734 TaxID=2597516 RepID=UPI00117D7981|nr:hypothetical protein [Skermania sp. ID1734]TSD94867.1 hypothetical protein FOS14_19695 [Skermania sp. ID1734]